MCRAEITEHHPEAGPALLKIARETKDTETRWLAIRGIGWLKYKEAAPFLRESLHSRSNYVRANSATALGEVHDVSAVADLIHTLAVDEDSGVLEQTSMALQILDAKEAIPVLKARSDNPSPQTRVWIVGAIEALGSKDVSFFAAFLFDKNEFVAAYAAHAIERITKEDFGFPHCGGGRGGPCALATASIMPDGGGTLTSETGHSNNSFLDHCLIRILPEPNMFNRTVEPHYREMQKNVLAQISAGRLTEDSELSKILDSLELVELTMEVEESGVEPAVEIKTVRDFLWLCRAMDFQRQRKSDQSPDNAVIGKVGRVLD